MRPLRAHQTDVASRQPEGLQCPPCADDEGVMVEYCDSAAKKGADPQHDVPGAHWKRSSRRQPALCCISAAFWRFGT
jgi:hypothetical protein